MELMPGYKQTEVGIIPEDWTATRLGDLFEVTSSKRVFQSEWKTYGVPFYRARELAVLGETGKVDNELFIAREMYESFKRSYGVPEVGDMLVTGVGTLGKVYVVAPNHEFYFKDGNIIWFKIAGSVCPDFLRQLYLTPVVKKQIGDASAGTTVGTYTISGAKKTVIPTPPLREQRAIASALRDVDALLATLDHMIAKKRDLKQAAMQQLLTGKTRLPGFSGEWDEKPLSDIGESLIGLTYSPSEVRQYGTLVLRSSNVQNGSLYFDDNVFVEADIPERIMVRPGDILLCVRNGSRDLIGKSALIDERATGMTFGAFMAVFRSEHGKFLYHAFQSETFKKQINEHLGATINQITNKSLNSFKVMFPPTNEERTKIATVLSDMDSELTALESRRDKTSDIKQAMMQELLTGKTRLV